MTLRSKNVRKQRLHSASTAAVRNVQCAKICTVAMEAIVLDSVHLGANAQQDTVELSVKKVNAQASHVKMVVRALARTSVSAYLTTLALNAQ